MRFLVRLTLMDCEGPTPVVAVGDWNLQEWKMTDKVAGVEFAGLENGVPTVTGHNPPGQNPPRSKPSLGQNPLRANKFGLYYAVAL